MIRNILWTCGWDSTYRLLELLLVEKVRTQPVYIIDRDRKSLQMELKTIDILTQKIQEKYPETQNLMVPTLFVEKDSIAHDPEINKAYQHIKSIRSFGSQYEWLSAYCKQQGFQNMELCIEKNSEPNSITEFLYKYQLTDTTDLANFSDEDLQIKKSVNVLFDCFSLPIINVLKPEMEEKSKQNDWLDIMYLTWFCHKPKNGKPCGKCNPCRLTIMKGMQHRIPFTNRLKGYLKIYKLKLKNFFK